MVGNDEVNLTVCMTGLTSTGTALKQIWNFNFRQMVKHVWPEHLQEHLENNNLTTSFWLSKSSGITMDDNFELSCGELSLPSPDELLIK